MISELVAEILICLISLVIELLRFCVIVLPTAKKYQLAKSATVVWSISASFTAASWSRTVVISALKLRVLSKMALSKSLAISGDILL